MRWDDERYVRLYTRDTANWTSWPWQARALLPLLMRKVDRAGLLHVGRTKVNAMVAAMVALPVEVVTVGMAALTEHEPGDEPTVRVADGVLCLVSFMAAQEARMSDAARQRESRERARDVAIGRNIVNPAEPVSQPVTACHTPSQPVTPSLSDPSLADPSRAERERAPGAATPPPRVKPGRPKKPDPIDQHRAVAAELWQAMDAARMLAIPGARSLRAADSELRRVAVLLEAGRTREECEHVIAVYAADSRRDPAQRRWFDGVSMWRPENFARALGRTPEEPKRQPAYNGRG
ncbi:MAG: hypothetical protein IT515_10955 [Burkholderiales bacterium]|nr:hypothetical protein [Burkholderiales bacterium]